MIVTVLLVNIPKIVHDFIVETLWSHSYQRDVTNTVKDEVARISLRCRDLATVVNITVFKKLALTIGSQRVSLGLVWDVAVDASSTN
jgi:hypothetical protein